MAMADVTLLVPSTDTQHIQELQLMMIHLMCELIEEHILSQALPQMKSHTVTLFERKSPRRRRHPAHRVGTLVQ